MSSLKEYIRYGINTDTGDRWEKGIDHHWKSKEILKHINMLDVDLELDLKVGGDGDSGESLMYFLDMYFELQEKKEFGGK